MNKNESIGEDCISLQQKLLSKELNKGIRKIIRKMKRVNFSFKKDDHPLYENELLHIRSCSDCKAKLQECIIRNIPLKQTLCYLALIKHLHRDDNGNIRANFVKMFGINYKASVSNTRRIINIMITGRDNDNELQ